MDVGDPSGHLEIVEPLVKNVLSEGLVDIVSLNENEARWFAWAISGRESRWEQLSSDPEDWLSAAQLVSTETGTRIDLHTPHFAASIYEDSVTSAPAFDTVNRVACGAGDAWNAGSIYGILQKLSESDRMVLANAVASLYVVLIPRLKRYSHISVLIPPLSPSAKDLLADFDTSGQPQMEK
jgi:sugar/nucleoside kinase (ribokinase family)